MVCTFAFLDQADFNNAAIVHRPIQFKRAAIPISIESAPWKEVAGKGEASLEKLIEIPFIHRIVGGI
jgi:hypothetical protein